METIETRLDMLAGAYEDDSQGWNDEEGPSVLIALTVSNDDANAEESNHRSQYKGESSHTVFRVF